MSLPATIERISPPDKKMFYNDYVRTSTPVVIQGMIDNWLAYKKWNFDYFLTHYSNVKAGAMALKGNICDVNTYTESDQGRHAIKQILQTNHSSQNGQNNYVVASPVEQFPSSLSAEYYTPIYCEDGKFKRSRIYMGPKGVVTSLHQDLPENLYALVKGGKRITLFNPTDKKYVYPYPLFSRHPNFSQIDPEQPDYERFPKSKYAKPFVVDLKAGETLFIPSLWWHHLHNLEDSIAINFWWSQGWKTALAWGTAMYKKYS